MNTKTLTIQSLKTLEDNHGIPYAILQIRRGDEYHDKRFERFDRTVKNTEPSIWKITTLKEHLKSGQKAKKRIWTC